MDRIVAKKRTFASMDSRARAGAVRGGWAFFLAGAALVGLGVTGPLHELGHDLAARICGVRVTWVGWTFIRVAHRGTLPLPVLLAGSWGEAAIWTGIWIAVFLRDRSHRLALLALGGLHAVFLGNLVGDDFRWNLDHLARAGRDTQLLVYVTWIAAGGAVLCAAWYQTLVRQARRAARA